MPRRKILLEQKKQPSGSASAKSEAEIERRFSLSLWAADVGILIALWFILVGTVSWPELAIGLTAALMAAMATEVARSIGFARFYPRLRWFAQTWRVPGEVLVDCGILIAVLAGRILRNRQERGFLKVVPFESGGAGARSAAKRALAIFVGTLSPNTCVVDIEPGLNFAMLHQIRAHKPSSFIRDVRDE